MRFLTIFFALLAALLLIIAIAYASPGVALEKYPRNVTSFVPANDDTVGRPSYRQGVTNTSNAPFAVILKVVGHKNQQGYFWLTDNQSGNTVQTYNRFVSGADKDLPPQFWLDESDSRPTELAPVNITADVFYLMVIGRITGTVSGPTIDYTVNYEIGSSSGSLSFASNLITSCVDWYLNWNDTDPESGDPASGADFVELLDNNLNSFTTAPVDAEGYFEVMLPDGANGQTWSAEARTESLSPVRSWVTTISSNSGICNELINAGTGGPTKVELVKLKARVVPHPLAIMAVMVLVLVPVALLLAYRSNRGP